METCLLSVHLTSSSTNIAREHVPHQNSYAFSPSSLIGTEIFHTSNTSDGG